MEGTNFEDSNPTKVDLSNNETFAVCEEHTSHENSSEGTSISENQIENMFSKQMYLSNSDFKKGMQMMKNQMLEVVNTFTEKVDDLEKKLEKRYDGWMFRGDISSY